MNNDNNIILHMPTSKCDHILFHLPYLFDLQKKVLLEECIRQNFCPVPR